MKKGLLIFSIITTVFATLIFAIFASSYFNFLNFHVEAESGEQVAGSIIAAIFGGLLGGLMVFILNILSLISSSINMIPNAIHFKRSKKPIVVVFFVIACLLLAATLTMLIYFIASGSIRAD